MCVRVSVYECVAKPFAVELRCHATALISCLMKMLICVGRFSEKFAK